MASGIKETDNGWNNLKKSLLKLGNLEVVVGVPGRINFSVPTTAAIGAVHEFGSTDGTIPERSFLRSTFDVNEAKYTKLLAKYSAAVVKTHKQDAAALFRVGETVRNDVVNRIRKGEIKQDLKPETIDGFIYGTQTRRGNNPALIASGNLVGSIVSEVRKVG